MELNIGLLDLIALKHPDLKNGGFAHVANVGKLQVVGSHQLTNGLEIRKATPVEADTLSRLVSVVRKSDQIMPRRNPYESSLEVNQVNPRNRQFHTTTLPKDEWRYHVIAFKGSNHILNDFVDASILTQSRIELGPCVFRMPSLGGPGFIGASDSLDRVWEEMADTDDYLLCLNTDDLNDMSRVFQKMSSFQEDGVGLHLRTAIKSIHQLDKIPKNSPLCFLGYMSVLESLITHAPESNDPSDSLTRQVTQKMILIGNRSKIPIAYSLFGDNIDPEKIWKRLYGYRSVIAHGLIPNFKKELQCLKDSTTALSFISSAVTTLMRQTLEEPELIDDLKDF